MKVKAGKQVIDAIQLAYAAGKPVLLEGKHGVGKSQIIEQAAQTLGVGCVVRDLSLMEPPDLIGLPMVQNGVTKYAAPAFLPTKGKGLICFEELNRSEKYMMAPCLQLLTARTLNDYKLPKGWLPVAAINPSNDGYEVNDLDPALLSRFVRIQLMSDVVEWLEWAEENQVHDAVIRYAKRTRDIFESDDSNPRSWTYVSDILYAHEAQRSGNDAVLGVTVAGLVGDVHAAAFIRFHGNNETPLTAQQILTDYRRCRRDIRKWVKGKRTDLLAASAKNLMTAFQSSDVASDISGDEVEQENISRFMADLPPDLARKVKTAARRNGAIP